MSDPARRKVLQRQDDLLHVLITGAFPRDLLRDYVPWFDERLDWRITHKIQLLSRNEYHRITAGSYTVT